MNAIELMRKLTEGIKDGSISHGEPVFLLKGSDMLAAETVRQWADKARAAGSPEEKVLGALEISKQMIEWPVKRVPGIKDADSEVVTTEVVDDEPEKVVEEVTQVATEAETETETEAEVDAEAETASGDAPESESIADDTTDKPVVNPLDD